MTWRGLGTLRRRSQWVGNLLGPLLSLMPLIRPLPVLPFTGVPATVTPAGVLGGVPSYVRTNWADAIEVVTAWRTEITYAMVTGQEQRHATRARPLRVVRAS